jgi:hypothetical protein
MDYMVYAYLQLGEDDKAEEILKEIDTLKGPYFAAPPICLWISCHGGPNPS